MKEGYYTASKGEPIALFCSILCHQPEENFGIYFKSKTMSFIQKLILFLLAWIHFHLTFVGFSVYHVHLISPRQCFTVKVRSCPRDMWPQHKTNGTGASAQATLIFHWALVCSKGMHPPPWGLQYPTFQGGFTVPSPSNHSLPTNLSSLHPQGRGWCPSHIHHFVSIYVYIYIPLLNSVVEGTQASHNFGAGQTSVCKLHVSYKDTTSLQPSESVLQYGGPLPATILGWLCLGRALLLWLYTDRWHSMPYLDLVKTWTSTTTYVSYMLWGTRLGLLFRSCTENMMPGMKEVQYHTGKGPPEIILGTIPVAQV